MAPGCIVGNLIAVGFRSVNIDTPRTARYRTIKSGRIPLMSINFARSRIAPYIVENEYRQLIAVGFWRALTYCRIIRGDCNHAAHSARVNRLHRHRYTARSCIAAASSSRRTSYADNTDPINHRRVLTNPIAGARSLPRVAKTWRQLIKLSYRPAIDQHRRERCAMKSAFRLINVAGTEAKQSRGRLVRVDRLLSSPGRRELIARHRGALATVLFAERPL